MIQTPLYPYKLTRNAPRICILAIISEVKSSVATESQQNVQYCRNGCRSKVFGVFSDTDVSDIKAHSRISRRTHSYGRDDRKHSRSTPLVRTDETKRNGRD